MSAPSMNRHALRSAGFAYPGQLLALSLGYVALGRLGLAISPVSRFASLVWPPTGLSLAALLIGGYRLWPAVVAGALATSLGLGAPPLVACGIAAASTLEAILGTLALRRLLDFHGSFDRCVDVLAFALPVALLSTAVGATARTVSLALGGLIAEAGFAQTWLVWWVGGFISDLVVAPFVLTWAGPRCVDARSRPLAEITAVSALLIAGVAFVFTQRPEALARIHVAGAAILLPSLIWAALRFRARGAATATFVVAVAGVWGTSTGHGNFARESVLDGLLNLHFALGPVALTVLGLASVASEREQSLEALRNSESLLRAVIDGTTDVIFIKDRLGRYMFINAAGARLQGRPAESIIGQDDTALLPIEEARRVRELDQEVMGTGEPRIVEMPATIAGTTHVFQASKVPYRDRAGEVLGVIGITRDVTEQRSAELARARLAAIVDSSADAIVGETLDGTITAWNAAAELLYGYSREEAIGQPIAMLVPPEERDQLAWLLEQIRLGEHVVSHETVRRCKDGRRIEVALTLSPIHDASGTVVGGSAITHDLTECSERWRLASEAAHIGMWCWSKRGDRVAWTPLCRSSHGIGPDEEASYPRFVATLHPDDRERVERAIQRSIAEHDDYRIAYRVQWPDGSVHWVSVLGRAFYDGKGEAVRMLGVALDITAQKQAEEERAELLARAEAARAEAESAARAKDDFLAVVSHELRTPLQSIFGWALVLRRHLDDLPTVKKGLDTIERNAKAQAQLIEDLLDVSRIVAGTLRLERRRVDLAEVIGAALDSASTMVDVKSIHVDAAIEPLTGAVLGDAQRLQQIVSNLLTNAVKFTPPQGRIGVRLGREGTTATITVEDSGCGISPEFLPYVFDRFRQAEEGATTRRRGGLGLGLSIVRHLVEAHGGTVKAESPGEGRGATFTVTLPLVSAERRALTEERAVTSGSRSKRAVLDGLRVLVVDDDPDACELLETVLHQDGAEVHTVQSARAALDALASFCPDVLLSDIGMPEEDGYALICELRARERCADRGHVPALALTAFASPADREKALSLGFEAHMAKPASPRDLASTVASLVGRPA